jgi:hypothetical protein
VPTDRPQTSFGLGFVVTETVRAPEPVLPDPFIGRAPLPSEDVAASRDVPTR